MRKMANLVWKFKEITGFKMADIARVAGVSRQAISSMCANQSMVYKTSVAFLLNRMIDKKIDELTNRINQLQDLKKQIIASALTNNEQDLREVK